MPQWDPDLNSENNGDLMREVPSWAIWGLTTRVIRTLKVYSSTGTVIMHFFFCVLE